MNTTQIAVLPAPQPINLHNIAWDVIVEVDGDDTQVYFALSPGDYENLSLNMAEILRWIRESKWQLEYYRDEATIDGDAGRRSTENSEDDSQ